MRWNNEITNNFGSRIPGQPHSTLYDYYNRPQCNVNWAAIIQESVQLQGFISTAGGIYYRLT